ncbi:MAG: ferritin family protein [Clostridiales bacterium]|nr:ferritin family protein [Clostridiales bacterium]
MRFFFNDLEAIKMAMDIEKRGERFYTTVGNKLDKEEIKEIFMDLAQQEREHKETFEELYKNAANYKEKFDDTYLFNPDISNYLSAMVETVVFPSDEKLDEILENIDNAEDALKLGIQAEKDSILFYTEMIIYSKLVEAKEAFRKLLNEEKKHLIDLQKKLQEIRSG